MDREQIRAIVREVIEAMFESSIPVGVSNRHVHLCQGHSKCPRIRSP